MNELHLFAGAGMKTCCRCKKEKGLDQFYRRKTGSQNTCIECSRNLAHEYYAANPEYSKEKAKKWREENPDRVKDYRKTNRRKSYLVESKRKYGITEYQFDSIINLQGNSCATCKKKFDWDDKQTKPHIDHCHSTGKVRGILCNKCNTVLGLVEDKPDVLSNLIEYLKCHGYTAKQ